MSDKKRFNFSYPLRLLVRAALTILLVWALNTFMGDYLIVTGGWTGFIVIGLLLTFMNLFIRPILNILTIPIRLLSTLIGIILVNGIFLWLVTWIADRLDPSVVTLSIRAGIGGWIVLALVLGIANWVMKLVLRT